MEVTARLGRVLLTVLIVITACSCAYDEGRGVDQEATNPPELPDLAITFATVTQVNDQSCLGHQLCLIVRVANLGTVDAVGFTDGCGTSSFGDPEPWAQYADNGVVPAGSTVTFRAGYAGLGRHLPARFTMFCEVDAAGEIDETDEVNNTYEATLSL